MYVLDTNIYSALLNNFPFKITQEFWVPLEYFIENGEVISTMEVYKELSAKFESDSSKWKWIHDRRNHFLIPTNEQCKIMQNIFKVKKFRENIKEKNMRKGNPEADTFLIALAKVSNSVVVTKEKYRPNSPKIPNMCEHFKIEYISYDDFLVILREQFDKLVALK